MKQTDVDKLIIPGKHLCDRGLYLQVAGPESRSWLFRYSFRGKERWLGLGSALDVSLVQARDARDDARALLRQGTDPVQRRKDAKVNARVQERSSVTFRERAEQYLQAHEEGWRNAKHRDQWRATLRNYVYPVIGNLSGRGDYCRSRCRPLAALMGRETRDGEAHPRAHRKYPRLCGRSGRQHLPQSCCSDSAVAQEAPESKSAADEPS